MRRHLGKTVGAGLLSLALLTSLSGCLQTAQAPQSTPSAQTGSQGESRLTNHAVPPGENRRFSLPSLSWTTSADGKGFYVPQTRFLNYYDPEVRTQVPLCSQSGCRHADESCEAYLADQVTGFVDYNGIWYVMSQESYSVASLWKVDPKAHQRTKVCEYAGKEEGESYLFHSGFISHGYAYLDLTHDTMTADGDIISDNYLVRVRLDTGEVQFLFENQYVKFLGAGENRVLISVPSSLSLPMSEKEYLEQNPGGNYLDYVSDFYSNKTASDDIVELREYTADLSSYQVLASGYIRGMMDAAMGCWGDLTLYAVEEELYLYNLATGERRPVEYSGTLRNFFFTDGRILLLTRDPGLKVSWAAVEGGPTQLLKDEGDRQSVTFSTHGESQDYVYGLYSGGEDPVTCILSKEDYFAQRFDNIIPVS